MPSTAQIGRAGELLVQLRLLLLGVDTSPMTTDAGIDLVAYSAKRKKAVTIQVKSNEKAKPGGGKGRAALDWWISDGCPADLVALVDLRDLRVWLLTMEEIRNVAQQHPIGRHHIYMYTDPAARPRLQQKAMVGQFSSFLLENQLSRVV